MLFKLVILVVTFCTVVNADGFFYSDMKAQNMYSSCSQKPCLLHETCTDSIRRRNSYSCCSLLGNGDKFCTHHTNVRNWKEIIPFTFTMVLFLAFIIGVWCSLHYLIKKLITVCIQIATSNKTRKFITRCRILMGKPPRATRTNEIPVIIVQSQLADLNRSPSPPPQYELPPAYDKLPKYNSKEQLTGHASSSNY